MAWIIGIDEAGYGPNLGPFVMASVACRVPDDCCQANLWHLLAGAVRRGSDADDGRLFVDDSKIVHQKRGVAGLEHGVLASLWGNGVAPPATLADLLDAACPDHVAEMKREVWYRGAQALPVHRSRDDLKVDMKRFADVCARTRVGPWHVRAVLVCPTRFNELLDEGGSKSHVLAHALTHLLRWQQANLADADSLRLFIDKHGGRNAYASLIQYALASGAVATRREGMASSVYDVHGLGRDVCLTFQPRADAEHFCVALASMTSKYLRELLMLEFNQFWRERLPTVRPTAGYPVDARRFFQEIRAVMDELGLREESFWRRK